MLTFYAAGNAGYNLAQLALAMHRAVKDLMFGLLAAAADGGLEVQ